MLNLFSGSQILLRQEMKAGQLLHVVKHQPCWDEDALAEFAAGFTPQHPTKFERLGTAELQS